jgi:predicted oxidoreductase
MTMSRIEMGAGGREISRLAFGCWRIAPDEEFARTRGRAAIIAAYEAGYTLFDHADIYGAGLSEIAFGNVLTELPEMRDQVVIATKCGVRRPEGNAPYRYDLSRAHIVQSCEESLERMRIERIDLYQLHRADWLMNPAEVAAAFAELQTAGKVAEFGVSNFTPTQVAALQRACPMKLRVNQVEISLARRDAFTDGTLDQCIADGITPLAWSPLAGGLLAEGARRLLPWQEGYETSRIVEVLDELAGRYELSRSNVAFAWLLKHPAGLVPIVGSATPERIWSAVAATQVELSREDWYLLLEAARGERLP